MSKVLIVFAHAEPESFNGALFRSAIKALQANGHEVQVSDLYAMPFDPVSDRRNFTTVKDPHYFKQQIEEIYASEVNGFAAQIELELQKLEWCDLMIWQFPLWWFGLPAILKGWVDRVFAMGRTYGGGKFYDTGVFRGKRALLSLTTGGPAGAYVEGGFNGDMEAVLRPIQRGMLRFVGFEVLTPHVVYAPAHLTDEQRQAHLTAFTKRLQNIASEEPIDVGDY
jgi:NAD(P)H dehydrogenase (quinone)